MCSTEKKILLIWLLQKKLDFQKHKLFAEWLGVDTYKPPGYRVLASETVNLLLGTVNNSSEIFRMWLVTDVIESYYTEAEQIEVCKNID